MALGAKNILTLEVMPMSACCNFDKTAGARLKVSWGVKVQKKTMSVQKKPTKPKSTCEFLDYQRNQTTAQLLLQARDVFLKMYFQDHADNAAPEFWAYLGVCSLARPATATEIATAASLNRKSVDRFLQTLVDRKMIARDGKHYTVSITPDRAGLDCRMEAFNQIEAKALAVVAAIRHVRQAKNGDAE
jgi:predicted transcriptional regulator